MSDPRWPSGTTERRALVECGDPTVADGFVRALREQGYAVVSCGGPAARSSGVCPLVEEHVCGLVQGADVVVHALDPADPANQEVLRSVRECEPAVVEVALPTSREELLRAVDRADPT